MLSSDMGASAILASQGKFQRAQAAADAARMRRLIDFTARSMETDGPVPFGCAIYHNKTGRLLLQARNAVAREHDPSSHAEVKAIRLATRRLRQLSLAGYTLYTTCEPCPMCMSAVLWASLDRVVYGATIAQCNRHCRQIQIPAREVAERSDMTCEVEGPLLGEECYALFTHPNMLRAFRSWATRKIPTQKIPARKIPTRKLSVGKQGGEETPSR